MVINPPRTEGMFIAYFLSIADYTVSFFGALEKIVLIIIESPKGNGFFTTFATG
jgi:hypothetical protein